jgi:hypothetical protein
VAGAPVGLWVLGRLAGLVAPVAATRDSPEGQLLANELGGSRSHHLLLSAVKKRTFLNQVNSTKKKTICQIYAFWGFCGIIYYKFKAQNSKSKKILKFKL